MKNLYYLMAFVFSFQLTMAQITITGNVVDDQGVPLPGATILEVGTSNGTATDFDGNYSITVEDGATISASYVGYESFIVTVEDQDQINFSLQEGNQLDEVIVTSLGIKREKQALGSAVSEVLSNIRNSPKQLTIGINDSYTKSGSYKYLKNYYRLTSEKILEDVQILLNE